MSKTFPTSTTDTTIACCSLMSNSAGYVSLGIETGDEYSETLQLLEKMQKSIPTINMPQDEYVNQRVNVSWDCIKRYIRNISRSLIPSQCSLCNSESCYCSRKRRF